MELVRCWGKTIYVTFGNCYIIETDLHRLRLLLGVSIKELLLIGYSFTLKEQIFVFKASV